MSGTFKYRVKYENSLAAYTYVVNVFPNALQAITHINDKIEELNEIGYDQVTLTSTYLRKGIISQYYHDPDNGHDMVEIEEHLYVFDMIKIIQLMPADAEDVISLDLA
jgi:hypothetical protein